MDFRVLYVASFLFLCLASAYALSNEGGRGCYKYNHLNGSVTYDCCNRDNPLRNPCSTFDCRPGFGCILDRRPCPFPLNYECPVQPQRTCRAICKNEGPCREGCYEVYQTNGCKTCFCDDKFKNPCEKSNCPDDSFCSLSQPQCLVEPCPPLAQCRKKCINERVQCAKGCLKYIEYDGCPRCICCNNCVNNDCSEDEECELQEVACIRQPCNPIPQCIKKIH